MKKISVKKQLVDFMIANGNDFRYTDMIKTTLKICRGKNYVYNREYDRGFYATNFSKGSNGYIVNGGGDCGVYKNANGKWSAKYYTKAEKINYILERQINTLSAIVSKERSMYDNNMNKISDLPVSQYRSDMFNYYFNQYRSIIDSSKRDAQNKMTKAILKLG
jgi:hypothetical protein